MRIGPDIVAREALIDEVAISADGSLVAYSRRVVVDGAHVRDLWTVPWSGGRSRRLTAGRSVDHSPAFAPDGATVAFLSDRDGGVDQVWLVAVGGGEPRRLTAFQGGVTGLAWRGDGRAVAVTAHDREVGSGPPLVRVIERLDWRDDDTFGLMDRPTHVHVVSLAGRARRLTAGSWFASAPRFLADGRVAFLADPDGDGGRAPVPAVHAVRSRDDAPVRVVATTGPVTAFAVGVAGAIVTLAPAAPEPPDDDPWQVAIDGTTVPGQEDRFAVVLSADGGAAVVADHGREPVFLVAADGLVPVLPDAAAPPTVDAVAAAGTRVAAVATFGTGYAEVYALEPGRVPRRLTTHGAAWFRRNDQPRVSELEVAGPAGPILTWVLSPPDAGDEPRATVLAIHGGPVWHWGPAPELGIQLLVQAGYRVALPNGRGSYGFGRQWIAALAGAWGDVDAADCHAVCDHLVGAGLVDPARLGVFGRSYGGFLTNWLLATSDRFAAGVAEASVANQVSCFGNSDCGYSYNPAAGLGVATTPSGVDLLWRQSPLRHVADLRTPLLLLQGEADLRCPTGDVEQLFVALRRLGRDVEYVLYPEGGHAYHREGRPDRRADRHRRLVGWFERHMPV